MGSKFFTWTKGDKRNAPESLRSAGIVPIPAECISIKGMDYGRNVKASSKANRKPLPLSFETSPDSNLKLSSSTDNSVALHDAAVQSATSLMAVMNDMLRSPHLSAHLQQRSASAGPGYQPMHGRPRSHTAPSTPLVEAPMMEPVELPGSLLQGEKSNASLHRSMDGKMPPAVVQSSNAVIGRSIERPHTSPHEKGYSLASYPGMSTNTLARGGNLHSPRPLSPRLKGASPNRQATTASNGTIVADEDTLIGHDADTTWSSMKRPSLSTVQNWPGFPSSQTSSQAGSTQTLSQWSVPQVIGSSSNVEVVHQAESEATLISQIAIIRASHDEHLSILREAHEKEIASHRAYIAFLEKRRGFPTSVSIDPKQQLKLDTSHAVGRGGELLSAEASANTLQSFESSLDKEKRASQDAITEVESLKRKLSLYRKAQAESLEIRRERDQLRNAAERSDRRILQLKDIVRKAKENEKTLRNAVEDLEARLVTANNERTDVLEGFHEACEKMHSLSKREHSLSQELDDIRGRLFYSNASYTSVLTTASDKTTDKGKHSRARSELSSNFWNGDPLLTQLKDLREVIASKDAQIQKLEQERAEKVDRPDTELSQSATITALEADLARHKETLAASQSDCDRFNSLLHNELRRQTRLAAQNAHLATPQVQADASAAASSLIPATEIKLVGPTATEAANECQTGMTNSSPSSTLIERELQHCLKEIVMYKLDIRGYKKDLKKANAELNSLRAARLQRPPTPDSQSNSSAKSDRSMQARRQTSGDAHAGLGISLPALPKTPTRTIREATSAALLSASPAVPEKVTSPPPRPKTPLGSHKKLPKPPVSRTPSPLPGYSPPVQILQRGETFRSLSESIISSYAKRGTPEQGVTSTPKQPGRSSDPVGTIATPALGSTKR